MKRHHEQTYKVVDFLGPVIQVDVNKAVFNLILDFIYKGRVDAYPWQLRAFMKAAEDLKVEGLFEESDKGEICESKENTWEDIFVEEEFTKEEVDEV